MDNAAFRSMVSKSPQNGGNTTTFKKPMALGSRARSSIPMTPRNVPGYHSNREFARQVAEHTSSTGEPPLKKFKSSAAPKGAKLGTGYVDRAQLRKGEKEDDDGQDKEQRLKNLEEQFKLGQIDQALFEQLKEQIGVGGDVGSTHLVKGLDWKLLERVRRGEDVSKSTGQGEDAGQEENVPEVDVDEELERALERDVAAVQKDESNTTTEHEQGPQQALTRDEILRQFREKRNALAVPAPPILNARFKKMASSDKPAKKKFVESVNGRKREVLIITKKDGTTKRKSRWIDPEDAAKPEESWGMEVPAEIAAKQKAVLEAQAALDENEDIFADAGDDYDPLAGIDSDDEQSGEEKQVQPKPDTTTNPEKRNYFSTGNDPDEQDTRTNNPTAIDPTIMAALKRAAEIRKRDEEAESQSGGLGTNETETPGAAAKSSAFLAKLKQQERLDEADLDYGFGESRFGDEDDEDDGAGLIYDDDDGDGDKKKGARKRGRKKRKGDKDNVQDVMSVLEGRNKNKKA